MERYLTKSRFKLALECITKLYYTNKKAEYADQMLDDPFLAALADGGFQVGELAKYYFCENPNIENITISTLDYNKALDETANRLNGAEKVIIAEAAFAYKNLFVRTDILVKDGDTLSIFEVKSKSWSEGERFLTANNDRVISTWRPYLYDVAFQKFVVSQALSNTNLKVNAYLMLVDKDSVASVDGLNQMFKIIKENNRQKVITKDGLKASDTGKPIITAINVDAVCDLIYNQFPVPTDYALNISFTDFVWKCAELYQNDTRAFSSLGSKCNIKTCQFSKTSKDSANLKSGFLECWMEASKLDEKTLMNPLVTELWGGRAGARSFPNELLAKKKFLLSDVVEEDLVPKTKSSKVYTGLSPTERRMQQINLTKTGNAESYIDRKGLLQEMNTWKFPLHMIDFETSMVALPFFKNTSPYQGIAFQFSHHTVDKDWNIEHKTQFLSFEPGVFPNYDFLRNLSKALGNDTGSIFRYHNHENTYLNLLYDQLNNDPNPPKDKTDLMGFIKTITHAGDWVGERDMIDLYEIVLRYYYSPAAKGSNSLKQILPAIIRDSSYLQDKYGALGIYGKKLKVRSLNFDDHIWIDPTVDSDPYKTLPKVFEEYETEQLDSLISDFENLADGGTAMMAYNYLQYSELPEQHRKKIYDALLRYCELDTMAMVMLCEAWKEWTK